MSVVCESLETYKKKVGACGCKWIKLAAFAGKLFASISSLIVVIMVLLNELIGLRFTLE